MLRKKRDTRYDYAVEDPRPSLRARLARFLAWVGGLFAVTVGIVVTQRLSRDSLALMVGLSCGIAAMLPTFVMGVFFWRRENARRQEHAIREQRQSTAPPVIVVSPPSMPGYSSQQPMLTDQQSSWGWARSQGERDFRIIGES